MPFLRSEASPPPVDLVRRLASAIYDTRVIPVDYRGWLWILWILYGWPWPLWSACWSVRYRTSFTQNVLQHSLEVSALCGMMAAELGMDVKKAKRAGLLHDIGKAVDHEVEGPHALIGADIAKKYNEGKDIVHAIAAHHEDQRPSTALAVLVQAADSISGARPGARKELLENYVKRLEELEGIATSFEGVSKAYAIQAGREIRVMVNPDNVDDDATYLLCKDIAEKIEKNLTYPGQIRVTVIRERRAMGFAK